jgi:hypothetical protein
MNKSFWSNKPVSITKNTHEIHTLLSSQDILTLTSNEINLNPFKLHYNVLKLRNLTNEKIDSILQFINKNYVTSNDDKYQLNYSKDLFIFYAQDAIVLEFYPNNKNNVIGYIIGKRSDIILFNQNYYCSEVNFLCIIPSLRNLKISSYMINVLSREIILHYNINTSHYTISKKIKSSPFSTKQIYHRMLNIQNLYNANFINNNNNLDECKRIFNTFNYSNLLNNALNNAPYKIQYVNNINVNNDINNEANNDVNNDVNNDTIYILYKKYLQYTQSAYDLYENVGFEEFKYTFYNSAFHHFIIRKNKKIVSYICLFRLDTYNTESKNIYRSGFYYYMFFDNNNIILDYLEFVNEYIYFYNIFDLITFSDIFNIERTKMKCIEGAGELNYYFYNLQVPPIKNSKNGLITI